MSNGNGYHKSHKLLLGWAKDNLKSYLNPRDYQALFEVLNEERPSKQLSRVDLGILKLTLEKHRPERTEDEEHRYSNSNAIKIPELADLLGSVASTIRRAKNRINAITKTPRNEHGLLLFHDMGICIQPTLWDAIRARAYSELQGASQLEAHVANIARADDTISSEKDEKRSLSRSRMDKFSSLTPEQQAKLLESLEHK